MSNAKIYRGSCHCGKVCYEVEAELGAVTACNCSLCSRTGWKLAFAKAAHFRLISGEDALTDYQFGHKRLHHSFCSTCGVRAFSTGNDKDGNKTYAVNVRCLDGVDAEAIETRHFDGKSL